MKKYPFKFLDAYNREDTGIFFGRDEEINALYEMIFQSPILLIYGASGTGKTSLIQCGLASKFQSHDWLALNVRRNNNLNLSFEKALQDAGGTAYDQNDEFDWLDEDLSSDQVQTLKPKNLSAIGRQFKNIYLKHFKPLYLIFDQFEELYILGDKQEQELFINTVKEILTINQPVKIIISIREEYLGYLYEFEREVPELLRKKLRVEPMNLDKVRTVIKCVCSQKQSNVSLQSGEEDAIADGIFVKIKGEEKTLSIPLPYLQVFLDNLYLLTTNDQNRNVEAVFTIETLNKMGNIGDVLRNFLDDQVQQIARNTEQATGNIWSILSPFVTLEGTKKPLSENNLHEELLQINQAKISSTLKLLEGYRILRYNENEQLYEIAHDALAKEIHSKRSDEEIAKLEVQRLFKNQIALKPEARAFFTEKQLQFIEPYLSELTLNNDELNHLYGSQDDLKRKKDKSKRRRQLTIFTVILAFAIMTILTIIATLNQRKINENIIEINRNQKIKIAEELQNYGDSYRDLGKMKEAYETYQIALDSLGSANSTLELYKEIQGKIK